jgi:hypothetical protein
MTTWLIVPVSLKSINTGRLLIPVSEIDNKNPKFPEFTIMDTIVGAHVRTGEEVVRAYKIKYVKMDDDQVAIAQEMMEKQQKEEKRQATRDAAARRRRARALESSDDETSLAEKRKAKKDKARTARMSKAGKRGKKA